MYRRITVLIFMLAFLALAGYGQAIESATFAIDPNSGSVNFRRILKLVFDQDLLVGADGLPKHGGLTLTVKSADGTANALDLTRADIQVQGGNEKIITISNLGPNNVIANAKSFEITIRQLEFEDAAGMVTRKDIEKAGDVIDLGDYTKTVLKLQKEAADAAKPTQNKNFFAGFNFASADKGSTEGNGELIANIPLQFSDPRLFLTVDVKKASATESDPKKFDIGIAYRRAFISPFISKGLKKAYATRNVDAIVKEVERIQRKQVVLGILTEVSGRIESEAMNFNTTNAVFDVMPFQLVSRVKRLGTNDLFMKFHIIPAAFEFGRNLRTENDELKKYYISRFKVGGELAFIYDPTKQTGLVKRVELTLRGVDRYLFREETAFDPETEKASGISKGHKTFYTADFKVFFSQTSKGRFGFKISRVHGPLPPTFNDVKTFTYGLVFESAEDQ